MHALIDHLRALADRRLGVGSESPLDPGIRDRATALRALADLLEHEPEMVRPGVRRTIEAHVREPLPGDVQPAVSSRGAAVLDRHGWDCPVGVVDHLRMLDRFAAAIVHDTWQMARVGAEVLTGEGHGPEDLALVLELHGFEVEAAASGPDPDPAYFLRRPGLTQEERRTALAAALESGRQTTGSRVARRSPPDEDERPDLRSS